MPKFQSVRQKGIINRAQHVWRRRNNGTWLCVICGGVSRVPSNDDLPDAFERLSQDDRDLCPPAPYLHRQENVD